MVVAACVGVSHLGTLTYSVPLAVLDDYAAAFGASPAQASLVQTAAAIPGVFLALALGGILGRIGVRGTCLVSLAAYTGGGVACVFVESWDAVVAARVLQGVGTVGLLSLGIVIAGNQLCGPQRDRAISYAAAGMMSGGVVGPILGGALGVSDARYAFSAYFLGAVFLPLCLVIREPMQVLDENGARPTVVSVVRGMVATGQWRPFRLLLLLTAAFLVVSNGIGQVIAPLVLSEHLGPGDVTLRGWLLTLGGLASTVTALNRPRFARRLRSAGVMWLSAAAFLLSLACLMLSDPWALAAGQALLGVSIGGFYPGLQLMLVSLTDTSTRGVLVGVWSEVVRIAQLLAPVLAGAAYAVVTPRTSLVTYGVATIVLLVAAAIVRARQPNGAPAQLIQPNERRTRRG